MLYKNEEPYKLNDKEITALCEHFHNKFPLRVIYPPERIVAPKNKHNKRPDKPNSISFDLKAIVKTDKGAETWRYAENVIIDEKGRKKFTPKKFIFSGIHMLDRKEIELIYFLYKKSPYCLNGENQGPMSKFMFEDLVTDAEKKVQKKQMLTKVDMLLYNEDLGLKEDRLRDVARAYFIKGVDTMSLSQVKIAIETAIHAKKDGIAKFFDMVNADAQIKSRSSLTKLIDMGKIVFEATGKTKSWNWKTKEGSETICRIPPDKSAEEALYDYYMGDASFREDVNAALLSSGGKQGTGKEE